jgi:hypothetical protein
MLLLQVHPVVQLVLVLVVVKLTWAVVYRFKAPATPSSKVATESLAVRSW